MPDAGVKLSMESQGNREMYQNIEKPGELPEAGPEEVFSASGGTGEVDSAEITAEGGNALNLEPVEGEMPAGELQDGIIKLDSPAAQRIREMIAAAHERQHGAGDLGPDGIMRKIINEEEISSESKEIVQGLKAHELSRIANRKIPGIRFEKKESKDNILDKDLEAGDVVSITELLIKRREKMTQLAQELMYLQDWYQDLDGMKHMPRHALKVVELVEKPPKQAKGLRRRVPNGFRQPRTQ